MSKQNMFDINPVLSSRVRFLKSRLSNLNMFKAMKALDLMIEEMSAEKGYIREGTGEHYYHHISDVMSILLDFNITDEITLTGGGLHDSEEDIPWIKNEYIKREYGPEVAKVVSLVTKRKDADYKKNPEEWYKDLRAILMDKRATLIKTADRIHNFSTLDGLPLEKQYRKAIETETYFFPFFEAARELYPEHNNFFFHAKTAIEPHLKKIKQMYLMKMEYEAEIEALKAKNQEELNAIKEKYESEINSLKAQLKLN